MVIVKVVLVQRLFLASRAVLPAIGTEENVNVTVVSERSLRGVDWEINEGSGRSCALDSQPPSSTCIQVPFMIHAVLLFRHQISLNVEASEDHPSS